MVSKPRTGRARLLVLHARKLCARGVLVALLREILVATVGVLLIAGGARVKITAPFTPVPFTLQTMALHYLLFTLGRKAWRPVLAYIALGLAGLPFFAFGGGPAYVLSPTFGYIVGFLAGTLVAGFIAPTGALSLRKCFLAGLVQLALVYVFGVSWLTAWYIIVRGLPLANAMVLSIATGLAPFIVWDLVKMLAAIPLARTTVVLYLYYIVKNTKHGTT